MIRKLIPSKLFFLFISYFFITAGFSEAGDPVEFFTLEQTIEKAIAANIGLKIADEEKRAAIAEKKIQRSKFLPTLGVRYQYNRSKTFEAEGLDSGIGVIYPADEYTVALTFTQPIFTGFSLLNQYKIADLGLNVSEISQNLARQDVILEAKKRYFTVLKTQKLFLVSQETVNQIEAQKEVAKNFYEAGLTPLNDLLQSQAELANARQDSVVAKNNLEIAKADFNTLLRRPINAPVEVKDILDYVSFEHDIDYCLSMAEKKRLETKIADLEIEIAERELKLAKKDYFPSINLEGAYLQQGANPDTSGTVGIFSQSSDWDITAIASWDFWEWGRSYYGVREKLSRLSQARYKKADIEDSIHFEVKQAYLRTKESEKNILTIEKVIERAKENFRINQELYKEQVATTTDVLNAQTLLSKTMTNYYNALYDFKIAKAFLYRAMGQVVME